ncbi:MAG: hypothetical protein V4714_14100 [Bacteroidota bacterium]
MKTEDWEQVFREKINELHTPPPQTQWNQARSWEQLKAQIPTASRQPIIQQKPVRPLWFYYAAASVSLLLLFSFAFTVYIRQQNQENSRLQAALLQAKNYNKTTVLAATASPAQQLPTKTNNAQKAPLPLRQAKHHFSGKDYEALTEKEFTQPTESTKETAMVANPSDSELALSSTDTEKKNALPNKEAALKAFLTQSAGNATRTETSVTLIFPGKETVTEENMLAEETPKPRKKRLFQVLANGPNTDNTTAKPAEWIGIPPFMIAKTNK